MDLYIIIASRRTGHHAIVHWIDSIIDGEGIIINDTDSYSKRLKIPEFKNNTVYYLDHNLSIGSKKSKGKKYCIFNIEERDLNIINKELSKKLGWNKIYVILHQRSFLNFYASKKNHGVEKSGGRLENGIEKWEQYTNEILGYTNILSKPFIFTYFDDWFSSKEYRSIICEKLGGKIENEQLNKVPKNGNGSTFDKMTKNGNARNMDVLNRWKKLDNSEKLKFKNQTELSKKLYYDSNIDERNSSENSQST